MPLFLWCPSLLLDSLFDGICCLFSGFASFLLLGSQAFVLSSSTVVIDVFFLALLLCGGALFLVVASASFGSPVPFATWSPFGMSLGSLGSMSRSGLRVPFPWWSPIGSCLHFSSSSDFFVSKVPWLSLELCLVVVSGFLTDGVLLFVLVQFR